MKHFLRSNRTVLAYAGAMLSAACSPSTAAEPAKPLIIAHRGGASLMPENTFPAFDNAVRLGVDMLEFDMMVTSDDQIAITHDGIVNPTVCTVEPDSGIVPGPVRSTTLADLQRFDCGSKHRAIYPTQQAVPGAHIPSLDELLARYKNADVILYGETKMPGPGEGEVDPVQFAELVDAAVRRHGLEDRFILQSADWRTIDAMYEINPHIRTCLLYVWREANDYLETARQHHATCMLLRLQDADATQVNRLRDAGIMVVSEVIDNEADWQDYLVRGDDALFTNDPASLIDFLRSRSESAPPW